MQMSSNLEVLGSLSQKWLLENGLCACACISLCVTCPMDLQFTGYPHRWVVPYLFCCESVHHDENYAYRSTKNNVYEIFSKQLRFHFCVYFTIFITFTLNKCRFIKYLRMLTEKKVNCIKVLPCYK